MNITLLYSCPLCGLVRIGLDVRARNKDEDLMVWMNETREKLIADHNKRSPWCEAQDLAEVLIPVGAADRIGGAPTLN